MKPTFRDLASPAIRIIGACFGAAVAGPLGAAIGGALGGAIGGPFAEVITEASKKAGETAGDKLLDAGTDSLLDRLKEKAPDLEGLYRKALSQSLDSLQGRLGNAFAGEADWFTHWKKSLSTEARLDLPPVSPGGLVPENLDSLFQHTLERLDAEGALALQGSTSISPPNLRILPEPLLAAINTQLPPLFREKFEALLVTSDYEQAWKQAVGNLEEAVLATVQSIKLDTTQINAKVDELLKRSAADAEKDKRLTAMEAELRQSEEEKEKFKKAYLDLIKSDPSAEELVQEYGLDGALQRKLQQAAKQDSERARTAYEVGLLQRLRFDDVAAYKAFRQAWQLEQNPKYGFPYALAAQGQNHNAEATGIYEQLLKLCSGEADLALIRMNLGALYRLAGRAEDAERIWSQALETYRRLEQASPGAYPSEMAKLNNNLGVLYSENGRLPEAEKCYRSALTLLEGAAKKDAGRYLGEYAAKLTNLAGFLEDQGRTAEAENQLNDAIGTYRNLKLIDPWAYRYNLSNLAFALNNRGTLYSQTQRQDKAEADYGEAISICHDLALSNPEAYEPLLSLTLDKLGVLYSNLNRTDEAEAQLLEALRMRRRLVLVDQESNRAELSTILHHLGDLYRAIPQHAQKAEDSYREALELRIDVAKGRPDRFRAPVARTLNSLAGLYAETGRFEEARKRCQEAGGLMEPVWTADPVHFADDMANILWTRALLCRPLGEPDSDACAIVRRALGIARSPSIQLSMRILIDDFCANVHEPVNPPPTA